MVSSSDLAKAMRSNYAVERTATRSAVTDYGTEAFSSQAERALGGRRSLYSR